METLKCVLLYERNTIRIFILKDNKLSLQDTYEDYSAEKSDVFWDWLVRALSFHPDDQRLDACLVCHCPLPELVHMDSRFVSPEKSFWTLHSIQKFCKDLFPKQKEKILHASMMRPEHFSPSQWYFKACGSGKTANQEPPQAEQPQAEQQQSAMPAEEPEDTKQCLEPPKLADYYRAQTRAYRVSAGDKI